MPGVKISSAMIPKSMYFKKDVVPLVALVSVVLTFGGYKGWEHLHSPDVRIDRADRSHPYYEHSEETEKKGAEWLARVKTHYRHEEQSPVLSIWEPFSAAYWRRRAEVAENPDAHTRSGKMALH